jgi:hypothetical protein
MDFRMDPTKVGHFKRKKKLKFDNTEICSILQGPRLMTWTTKSPIQGNQWVPLGCRALLGSVM